MKVGFLLGAGVSLSCGAPSTKALTDFILSSTSGVQRHSDCTYYVGADLPYYLPLLQSIRKLLEFLNAQADGFFRETQRRSRKVNYEDLYYLAAQLADATSEFENPAIHHFWRAANRFKEEPAREGFFRVDDLFIETTRYIRGAVVANLSNLECSARHIESVIEALRDQDISNVEIATLNHDLLIERSLRESKIEYFDGFTKLSGDLLAWDEAAFGRYPGKVRVLKLHGAVNWWRIVLEDGHTQRVCIATNGDVWHAKGPSGERIQNLGSNGPEILIGTFNKLLDYNFDIFADLIGLFRATLCGLDRLVVSGYSFGDKGVNACLVAWLRGCAARRLMIITPDTKFRENARGAIQDLLQQERVRIQVTPKKFEDVSWQCIKGWCKGT